MSFYSQTRSGLRVQTNFAPINVVTKSIVDVVNSDRRLVGVFDDALNTWARLRLIIPDDVRFWIAGGAFPTLIANSMYNASVDEGQPQVTGVKDWDVFSDQPDRVIEAINQAIKQHNNQTSSYFVSEWNEAEFSDFSNNHLANFTVPGILDTVQVIKRPFASPRETIEQFDYRMCMFALEGTELTYTRSAIYDCYSKLLYPNVFTYPLNSLKRLEKYVSRGYHASHQVYMQIAKAILNLDTTAEMLVEDMFYIGQHPRLKDQDNG